MAVVLLACGGSVAQELPRELSGRWKITRVVPTHTIGCWDKKQASAIIGTELEYSREVFRWKDAVVKNPVFHAKTIRADEFERAYSGGGAGDSHVSFRQLGIKAPRTKEISVDHQPANITGATIEIPGDLVLLKNRDTIVFSVCNEYFEAKRIFARVATLKGQK